MEGIRSNPSFCRRLLIFRGPPRLRVHAPRVVQSRDSVKPAAHENEGGNGKGSRAAADVRTLHHVLVPSPSSLPLPCPLYSLSVPSPYHPLCIPQIFLIYIPYPIFRGIHSSHRHFSKFVSRDEAPAKPGARNCHGNLFCKLVLLLSISVFILGYIRLSCIQKGV